MESRSAAIVFFYGLMWASALAAISDFRAFNTYACFHGNERWKPALRWLVSVLIVDVLPAFGLWHLYSSQRIVPPDSSGALSVVCAGIASLAVFAVPRLLHAAIATRHTYKLFYGDGDWLMAPEPRRKQKHLFGHLASGIGYVVIFWGLAATLGWLFDA